VSMPFPGYGSPIGVLSAYRLAFLHLSGPLHNNV
jgi:hypothetical protein